jgi:hypothetical protein
MNLCRVLPGGAELKGAVDEAIDACAAIGNLREDIHRCKEAAEGEHREKGSPPPPPPPWDVGACAPGFGNGAALWGAAAAALGLAMRAGC